MLTDPPCDGPCIDALDPRHAMASEQFIDGPDGEPMIGVLHRMANDHGPGPDPTGFRSAPMDAIISDQRVGEGEDLTREGWVREGLLIPCHIGAEDEFTLCRADRPEELTLEPAPSASKSTPGPSARSGIGVPEPTRTSAASGKAIGEETPRWPRPGMKVPEPPCIDIGGGPHLRTIILRRVQRVYSDSDASTSTTTLPPSDGRICNSPPSNRSLVTST